MDRSKLPYKSPNLSSGYANTGALDNVEAWKVLSKWDKPFLTSFSDQDPITKGADKIFQKLIPGCKGQPHQILKGGGHFLQEDVHGELSEIIVAFCESL